MNNELVVILGLTGAALALVTMRLMIVQKRLLSLEQVPPAEEPVCEPEPEVPAEEPVCEPEPEPEPQVFKYEVILQKTKSYMTTLKLESDEPRPYAATQKAAMKKYEKLVSLGKEPEFEMGSENVHAISVKTVYAGPVSQDPTRLTDSTPATYFPHIEDAEDSYDDEDDDELEAYGPSSL